MHAHQIMNGLHQIIGAAEASEVTITTLPGGASLRTYHRVQWKDSSWVVMVLAEEPIRSEEATSGPEPTGIPFVEIGQFLEAGGVDVPHIHHIDHKRGHIWLDDLGDTHLLRWLELGGDQASGYRAAIDVLVSFQRATAEKQREQLESLPICYARRFESALLRWELDHWVEWRVQEQLLTAPSTRDLQILDSAFNGLVSLIVAQPNRLVHRDFQSTNLMVTGQQPLLTLIDFQDALLGPWTYDLVALLRDSYVDLSQDTVDMLIHQYIDKMRYTGLCESEPAGESLRLRFTRDFHRQVLQRKLKDAGRFVYIDRVKNNPWYLQYVDRTMRFVRRSLEWLEEDGETPHIDELARVLRQLDPASFS